MKITTLALYTGLGALTCAQAAPLVYEPFDYPSPGPLTDLAGGTGWFSPWFTDAASVSMPPAGLQFTDSIGNILDVAGLAADTSAATTTRSFRDTESIALNDVWISFLYQLPATNNKFEGVSFYSGTQQIFTVSNPSTTPTSGIFLGSNISPTSSINTGVGTFGQTHLIVLKLTKAGGTAGADRVEAFIDPVLSATPSLPQATINGTNFNFNRIRIAGQDGATLLVDEIRIGNSFEDVTPHTPAVDDGDTDGDGLTDAQEIALGLDPNTSDAALIAGIQANPEWFGLFTDEGILSQGNGGIVIPADASGAVSVSVEVQESTNLTQWNLLEAFDRMIELSPGKNFLRVTLQDQ